nr:MAG TPA: hypothetical protein [Caudoviricetes sp.]
MPKKPSSAPVKRRTAKKAVKKAVKKPVRKAAVRTTTAKKPVAAKPEKEKRQRAKVIKEHPGNLVADKRDHVAIEAIEKANAKVTRAMRGPRKLTAVDKAAIPASQDQPPASSLVERVSDAIERELSKIEHIIGNPTRLHPTQRIETESRARVLASLARTLKEVMRLREQERGAGDDTAKAADDDAIPRDLDEFRRELSRRLEGLVAATAPVPDRGNEPG